MNLDVNKLAGTQCRTSQTHAIHIRTSSRTSHTYPDLSVIKSGSSWILRNPTITTDLIKTSQKLSRSQAAADSLMAVSDGLQPDAVAAIPDASSAPDMSEMSYAEQYDYLASQPKGMVNFKKPCKKPSLDAQVKCVFGPGSRCVP